MSNVIDDMKAELATMGWSNLDTLGEAIKADGTKAGSPAWLADIETAIERVEARRALAELERRSFSATERPK